jgi:hypothetical protein
VTAIVAAILQEWTALFYARERVREATLKNRRPILITTRDAQLEAQARLREYYGSSAQAQEQKIDCLNKLNIAEMGAVMWPHTYKSTTSDEVARDNWHDYVKSFQHVNPQHFYVLSQQLMLSDAVILMMGGARWVDEGLPVFRPSIERTASLMATQVSADMAEVIRPPFRAFIIDLPDGLISISNGGGKFIPATGVFVHVATVTAERDGADGRVAPGEYWRWMCLTKSDLTLWEMNRTTEEMIAGAVIPEDAYFGIGWAMDDHDLRIRRLVTRLIIGMCLDVAGKDLQHNAEFDAQTGATGPVYDVITDPTEVGGDAVAFVHAYLAGALNSPERRRAKP